MKLESIEFKRMFTEDLRCSQAYFFKYKFQIKLARGKVMDNLLGHKHNDFDFVKTTTPEQMKKMLDEEVI
ncbi:hypothetical protein QYM36_016774 [Artemia franciscana]|uniref:Poly A polymerase head domain-containing protein n=1 Tax=Artemia franciscana TaxID=6661 RepID=A0AA88L1R7_ARTSF|nr:hypothetical protein QYM36_016774 [Artemia franciscana]